MRSAKTQISLGIRPVWLESSLSAWRKLGSLATHWAHSEDSDQTGRPSWSESSLGAQPHCWFCHEAAHIFFHYIRYGWRSLRFLVPLKFSLWRGSSTLCGLWTVHKCNTVPKCLVSSVPIIWFRFQLFKESESLITSLKHTPGSRSDLMIYKQ